MTSHKSHLESDPTAVGNPLCQRLLGHGARLLAAIEALKKTPWVVLTLLFASVVGGLAQFANAFRGLADLVHPAKPDPRTELAKLGVPFTPAALAKAAADGDARAVGLLLDSGMRVGTGSPSSLVVAARGGFVDVARRLREAGSDPAAPGAAENPLEEAMGGGDTALEAAVKAHHPDVVSLFLERRLPAAAIADAYVYAAVASDVMALALLAPHLAQPQVTARNAIAAVLERTPTRLLPMTLEEARRLVNHPHWPAFAVIGRTDGDPADLRAMRAVLALKPPLDAMDANGQTLLHKAVDNDAPGMVALLLAAGASPRISALCQVHDEAKAPPLACAVVRGSAAGLASAQALIAAHADLEARDVNGATPLMLATGNDDPNAIVALLAAGADTHAHDASGRTISDYKRIATHHTRASLNAR